MNKLARYILIAISIAVVTALLWFFRDIVWYVAIAAVVSIMGKPLVHAIMRIRIARWHPPQWLAAMITLICTWAIFLLFIGTMIPLVGSQVQALQALDFTTVLDSFSSQIDRLDAVIVEYMPVGAQQFSLRAELLKYFGNAINASAFQRLFSSTASFVTELAMLLFSVTFITFFFLKEDDLFTRGLAFFFSDKRQGPYHQAMNRVNYLLQRYFIGIVLQSTAVMLCIAIGLLAVRIPWPTALAVGVISGLLNVIPFIGPIFALIIALLIVLIISVTSTLAIPLNLLVLYILLIFVAVRVLDNVLLRPRIFRSSAKSHPLEIFLVLLIAAYLAGLLGMFIAVPIYTVLRVFAKEFFGNQEQIKRLTKNI